MTNDPLFVIALSVVGIIGLTSAAIIWYLPIYIAKKHRHSKLDSIILLTFLGIFVIGITWVIALVWACMEDNSAKHKSFRVKSLNRGNATDLSYKDDPDVESLVDYNGPGRYEIVGVDKATKMDTVWTVAAESRENAQKKAELEGIAITSINFVDMY